ncbi:MAG: immunity 51 family protein [Oscillospiraceae bacterium]|nr:immunity 51 family protein [Oscillospiraceae bacterium]
MDFTTQITPFSWIEHENGGAAVVLYTSDNYKTELFKTRENEGFEGSGYDWESLAEVYIQEYFPDSQSAIEFDSEHMMFCAYSFELDAFRCFAIGFKEACENDELIADLFSRTTPQKPITVDDIQNILDDILNIKKK